MNRFLVTTLGYLSLDQIGWMLPHEHVFANFHSDDDVRMGAATVIERMLPALHAARACGITTIAEATAVGGARRADLMLAVSQAANLPLLLATGLFKEPAKQRWVAERDEAGLAEWMINELTVGIEDTGVPAGWIKLSVTDDAVQPHERVLLRAAAAASRATGAVVGCHSVGAPRANEALDVFERAGGEASRFIWVHTQTEPDVAAHHAFARCGAWIEYDGVDSDAHGDAAYLDWICGALEAGLEEQVLISHDRVGFNPAQPDAPIADYTHVPRVLLPACAARGVPVPMLDRLMRDNPFRAYARPRALS
jgi:phosphotriesterase-related protein